MSMIGRDFNDLDTPTLWVDLNQLEKNIDMAAAHFERCLINSVRRIGFIIIKNVGRGAADLYRPLDLVGTRCAASHFLFPRKPSNNCG